MMSSAETLNLLTLIALVITFCSYTYFAGSKIARLETKLAALDGIPTTVAELEVKIDTIWEFQMRRAQSELMQKGLGVMNSPITVPDEVKDRIKKWMGSLQAELKKFYQSLGYHPDLATLTLEIERRYGDRILKEICIPNGLFEGACLIIAAEIAREYDPKYPMKQKEDK